ncbi:MAG: alanine dehydrogenase [Chlorobi bacterium]|nr:alanine dehydrogenase [Chlorobiota bacterium]
MKLGIIKETKTPPDRRVTIPPMQGIKLLERFPNAELYIQPSNIRCYTDQEYIDAGLTLKEDLSDCDVLVGVKEVKPEYLIPNKKYFFFSHTTKKQPYNRGLLKAVMDKGITLIDHESLTDTNHIRLVAFGRWAGLVGAYNGLMAYGKRKNIYDLKPAYECHDMQELFSVIEKVKLPPIKILISGGGRVAHGAMETISQLGIKKVNPHDFLNKDYNEAVYCQIDPWHYTKRKDGSAFDLEHFFNNPHEYESTFKPFTKVTDMFIACHFWDPKSPVFITKDDMREDDFRIKVIADVSCDVDGPIASTIRASTIANPIYGYNPITEKEDEPYAKGNITVMAVDNLPGELPRDSSVDFGNGLIDKVFPSIFGEDTDEIIHRASITINGKLNSHFAYLQDWVDGKE